MMLMMMMYSHSRLIAASVMTDGLRSSCKHYCSKKYARESSNTLKYKLTPIIYMSFSMLRFIGI